MAKLNKKIKLSKEQKAENKKRANFQKNIKSIFVESGFKALSVNGKQFELGSRQNEIDHCFIYENIIIICEDTVKSIKEKEKCESKGENYAKNHKLIKDETSRIIKNNKKDFLEILRKFFSG